MSIITPATPAMLPYSSCSGEAMVEQVMCHIGLGIYTTLNYYAVSRYGKTYARLVVESPKQAYKLLETIAGAYKARILWHTLQKKLQANT
ncbi:MAG TPA: hypothetical protein EYP33_03605 [Pyrodictium sp.]|nr:hypothetical protein [Pyrodictium sp.]